MANKSEQLEQVVSSPEVRTIRLLQNKYGEKRDTVLAEVGETNSGLFWKLESGNFVPKDHEGLGWEWADLGPTPFGGRVNSLNSLSSSSNSSSSGGKRKRGATTVSLNGEALNLGTRLLGIAADHPTKFADVVETIELCEMLTALKIKKAQDGEPCTSSVATRSESDRLAVFRDLGHKDHRQESEHGSAATDADCVGVSGSTIRRDPGRQTFESTRS
jgi:hypothetical protein